MRQRKILNIDSKIRLLQALVCNRIKYLESCQDRELILHRALSLSETFLRKIQSKLKMLEDYARNKTFLEEYQTTSFQPSGFGACAQIMGIEAKREKEQKYRNEE